MSEVNLIRPSFTNDPKFIEKYSIPSNWICNIPKRHKEDGRKINNDSCDYPTKIFPCFCILCAEINRSKYKFGKAIKLSHSFSQEYMEEHYIGVYKRRVRRVK